MGQFPFKYQWPNLTFAVIYVVLSQKLRQNFYACMLFLQMKMDSNAVWHLVWLWGQVYPFLTDQAHF